MTFSEAAMIMMSGGDSADPVIQPLTVTENGEYKVPAGVDGFNPVSVKVPDRYDEGYQDGYKDGYQKGCEDTRNEIETNSDDPTHEKIYGDGYADGLTDGGCTFPTGTTFDDALSFMGDAGTISDTTTGVSIKITQYPCTGQLYEGILSYGFYCGTKIDIIQNGKVVDGHFHHYTWANWDYEFISSSFKLGGVIGNIREYSYEYKTQYSQVFTEHCQSTYLVNFATDDSQYRVSN